MTSSTRTTPTPRAARYTLGLLAAINLMNFYDRQVVGAVGERIKVEWQLSDGQLAGLTTAFVLLYAIVGIPLGRLADVGRRKYILAVGIIAWSVFTGLSGLASSFAMLILCRLAVGIGEASAAPAANSMIGDLFPGARRGRAIAIFMLGLPFGLGASYVISGLVTQATGGWRPALFVAAVPGLLLGLLALFIPEPERGAADPDVAQAQRTSIAAIRHVLSLPTMRWIIVSGALFNLNTYALSAFNTSYLIRFHGLNIDIANRFSGAIFGIGGAIGMIAGGWIGDRSARGGPGGRMRLAAIGSLLTVPLTWIALEQPAGNAWGYAMLMLVSVGVMYVYYTNVMATIYDLVEPRERGTAMAVYFFVFYLFIAVGLLAFGRLSDDLAARALATGLTAAESRSAGLHGALYAIPVISVLLTLVLWAGARTAPADHARLRSSNAGMRRGLAALLIMLLLSASSAGAQSPTRNDVLTAARAIMTTARYATLATIATDGAAAQARIVDPLAPDSNFTIWVATNPATRKVAEVQKRGRATLLYFDATALEYVTLVGTASVVTNATEKQLHWKREWDPFYAKGPSSAEVVLLRIQPMRLEVVSPSRKIVNDTVLWRPPTVQFGPPKRK